MTQPMQPLCRRGGVIRFKENAIVRYLLGTAHAAGVDFNTIALLGFSDEDRQQFAQLIGYSVSGYGDLFSDQPEVVAAADAAQAAFERGGE